MAETRALDRSTLATQANVPDSSPLVKQIQQALSNLSNRDMPATQQAITEAMSLVTSSSTASSTTKM
jgi:hypothetical protein